MKKELTRAQQKGADAKQAMLVGLMNFQPAFAMKVADIQGIAVLAEKLVIAAVEDVENEVAKAGLQGDGASETTAENGGAVKPARRPSETSH